MSKDISIIATEVPAHVKTGGNLGNENISSENAFIK